MGKCTYHTNLKSKRVSMTKPLLSIVIANYNYGRFLEDAIRSINNQGMEDKVELIICDAASTDNSLDIIKQYANGLPAGTHYFDWQSNNGVVGQGRQLLTWWCSEQDEGQAAAFNKGFSHARGEWLTWLNSDDIFLNGALKAFECLVKRNVKAEWVTGNKLSFDAESKQITIVNWGPHWQPPFLKGRHAFSAVFGPASFLKKSLYESAGAIDENLHYAMDTEYWARLTMLGVRQVRLHKICWAFRIHQGSKTTGSQDDIVKAKRQAETAYLRKKTGYVFNTNLTNVWYLLWILWRVVDFSWLMRAIMKRKYEGKLVVEMYSVHN